MSAFFEGISIIFNARNLQKLRARKTLREIYILILLMRHCRPREVKRLNECLAARQRQRQRQRQECLSSSCGLGKTPGAFFWAEVASCLKVMEGLFSLDLCICPWASFNQSANKCLMNMYFMLKDNRQKHNILSQQILSLVLDGQAKIQERLGEQIPFLRRS